MPPEMVRIVDVDGWARRDHYRFFRGYAQPFFNLGAEVDVTSVLALSRRPGGPSFFLATAFLALRAVNAVPELRYRIRGDDVVEHEIVHGASTVLRLDETFGFAFFDYREAFAEFAPPAGAEIERVRATAGLEDRPGRDDLVFFTVIPWVSFTSFEHAVPARRDSVPRIVFGRYRDIGARCRMPVSIAVHHALADGLHAGRFFALLQDGLDDPSLVEAAARSTQI
jgi:chloramphenicol O-acetyltransferase type A